MVTLAQILGRYYGAVTFARLYCLIIHRSRPNDTADKIGGKPFGPLTTSAKDRIGIEWLLHCPSLSLSCKNNNFVSTLRCLNNLRQVSQNHVI